jgi:nucleoside-diphosphate kinase
MTNLPEPKLHKERSLVVLKPDTIQRSLVGEVISRIERTGLKLVAFKFTVPERDTLIAHYNKDEAWFLSKGARVVEDLKAHGLPIEKEPIEYGRDIIEANVKYMRTGPVLAFVVQGNESVAIVKKLVGETEPATSDVGTIRGDLTVDSYGHAAYRNTAVRNLLHCSDSPSEAEREIALWFKEDEIIKYRQVQEQILYDVNLDGILE